jgi:hypothetical protein
MNYQKKYLEYKKKYYLLKQTGGMPPKQNPWGKMPSSASVNPDLEAYTAARDALLAANRKVEEEKQAREAEKRRKEEEAAKEAAKEAERVAEEERQFKLAEEAIKAEEEREAARIEAERIRKEKELSSYRLPPEMIAYIMKTGDIKLERLIKARENVEFKGIVDNYILEQLNSNSLKMEKVIKIYNLIPELKARMKPIILNNIMHKFTEADDLLLVFKNFGSIFHGDPDLDFRRSVYDGVCRKDVSTSSLSELIALYNIIPKQSIFNLITSNIETGNISLSELIKLYSFHEFKMLLEPIIEKSYNIKFSDKPALFKPYIHNYKKLLYITSHFLCNRLFSLNRTGEIGTIITTNVKYSIDIEYIGRSSIVRGPTNFTYSFYKLSNRLFKQRLGWGEDDEGEFNFDNLLQSVIYELENRTDAGVRIKSFSLVKTTSDGKQNLFKFDF